MIHRFFTIMVLLTVSILSLAQDESETNCGSHNGYNYCLYPGTGERKDEVLYHLHGVFMDETGFTKNKAYIRLQKLWEHEGKGHPQIISISYGPVWILAPKNSRYLSGLLDQWNRDSLAELESFLGIHSATKRFLIGDSMGGHNALKLFRQMPEAFDKVMALCPAQLMNSPYASIESVIENLPQVQSIWPMYFAAMGLMASYYDEEAWENESPVYFDDEFLKYTDKLNVVLTEHDMYGFTKTNLAWFEEIKKHGKNIEYKIEPGLHCIPNDMTYVNEFLK